MIHTQYNINNDNEMSDSDRSLRSILELKSTPTTSTESTTTDSDNNSFEINDFLNQFISSSTFENWNVDSDRL